MDNHMQVSRIHFPSPKTWTFVCNLGNFYPFSKCVNYHMQFLDFLFFSKNMDYHMQFCKFLSLLQKHGLSYAISRIYIPSPNTWTIISIFWNYFPFSINMDYHMQVSRNPFDSPKTWTIKCNLWNFFLFYKT